MEQIDQERPANLCHLTDVIAITSPPPGVEANIEASHHLSSETSSRSEAGGQAQSSGRTTDF
jgi:hypothetical protein